FGRPAFIGFSIALVLAAILAKLSCAIGVLETGVRKLAVAIGMIPRGEVTLVFAALGAAIRLGQSPLLDRRICSTCGRGNFEHACHSGGPEMESAVADPVA